MFGKKKELRQFIHVILIHVNEDDNIPMVLLTSEKGSKKLSLPLIELDKKITIHDAIEKYFKNIIPLNVDVSDVFRVYDDEDDENKYKIEVFYGAIDEDENVGKNLIGKLDINKEFLDIAAFTPFEVAIVDSKLDDLKSHVDKLTGLILEEFYDEIFSTDDGEVLGDSSDKEREDINSAVEGMAAKTNTPENEFLDGYDATRDEKVSVVNVTSPYFGQDAEEKITVGSKVISIGDAKQVILVFKDAKDLKVAVSGTTSVNCTIKENDTKENDDKE